MKKLLAAMSVILACFIVVFGVGTAYYNTKRIGFDEDAVLFEKGENSFTILDYTVEYEDVKAALEQAEKYLPGTAYSL